MAITHATSTGPIGETQWLENHTVDAVALRTALNVADGATANAADAALRDRATHTGTQAASTITGLASVATTGAYSDLSGAPNVANLPTADQKAALDAANAPGAGNAVATMADIGAGGGGTVMSVGISGSDGIEVDSGSPVTGSGTIALGVDAVAMRTHLNVESGATANASDTALRDRATHTGTQAVSTITGLQGSLDGKLTASSVDTLAKLNALIADATLLASSAFATVATTGEYSDIAGAPSIPTALADLDTTVTGAQLNADHAKLGLIEAGATADQSAAEVPVSLTATNYTAATPNVEAHLTGINTALGSVGTVEGATNALTFTGSNGIEVDATSTGANAATVDISINQLGTYAETPDTLTSTAGALTIPLDGKTYTITVTEDTTVTFSLPASGRGSAIVHFIQDATGGRIVSFPAATEWADSTATDVATDANARTRAVLTQFSSTGVDADLEVRGTVA